MRNKDTSLAVLDVSNPKLVISRYLLLQLGLRSSVDGATYGFIVAYELFLKAIEVNDARLHAGARQGWHSGQAARSRDLAQSISRLYHPHPLPRIHVHVPKTRLPGLRNDHHRVRPPPLL